MLKTKLGVLGGGMTVGAGAMFMQAQDIEKNYTKVEADIIILETDCFIENSDGKVVDKKTDDLASMDCDLATSVAAMHNYDDSDIQNRVKVKYSYISPVDAMTYHGEFTRTRETDQYALGGNIMVYAHNSQADESRTIFGNLFLSDE